MNISRRGVVAAAAAAAFAPMSRVFAAEVPSEVLVKAMAGTATPGIAALVIRSFKPESELVAGVRVIGETARVEPGDRWHLGSDGKAMTAAMIARLVERGVLAWDTPLERMLPDYVQTMHPSYRDVTLVELLSHRSGLPSDAKVDFWDSLYDDPTPRSAQRLKYIREGLRAEPAAPKRADVSYSNDGFVVAAVCAERATGRAYEDLMATELFAPLKINSASFDQHGGPGEPSGHSNGQPANGPHDGNPRMFAPAGGIRMNLPDWARFCIDQMQGRHGRGRILRTETYRFLQTPQGETNATLGWGYQAEMFGRRGPALFLSGSDGNWQTLATLFQETGNGVLVATNAYENMQGDRAAYKALISLVATVAPPK